MHLSKVNFGIFDGEFGNERHDMVLQEHRRPHVIGMAEPAQETVSIVAKICPWTFDIDGGKERVIEGESVLGIFKGMQILLGWSPIV
jgi:hypothetical protein